MNGRGSATGRGTVTGSGLDDPELKAAERAEIRSSWLRCLGSAASANNR